MNWWLLAPATVAIGLLAVVLVTDRISRFILEPARYLEAHPGRNTVIMDGISSVEAIVMLVALMVAPITIAILRRRFGDLASKRDSWAHIARTLILLFALPGSMAILTSFLDVSDTYWNGKDFVNPSSGKYYEWVPATSSCAIALQSLGARGRTESQTTDSPEVDAEFWYDSAINTLLFDAPSAAGCSIRRVDINHDDIRMAVVLIAFNVGMATIVLAVLLSMFRHRVSALARRMPRDPASFHKRHRARMRRKQRASGKPRF